MKTKSIQLALILSLFSSFPVSSYANEYITIGSGSVDGVNYPVAMALCKYINRDRAQHNVRCSVESSNGSSENLSNLKEGSVEFAIVLSDLALHRYNGDGLYSKEGNFKELRAVISLHTDAITLVVKKDANINTFTDLVGKKVSIGTPESNSRIEMDMLLEISGLDSSVFSEAFEYSELESEEAFCNEKISAFIMVTGHPSRQVEEVFKYCNAKLISLDSRLIDNITSTHPEYSKVSISKETYPGQSNDFVTLGLTEILLAKSDVSSEIVFSAVSSLFNNIEELKNQHPSLISLSKEKMLIEGILIPLHAGSKLYIDEIKNKK